MSSNYAIVGNEHGSAYHSEEGLMSGQSTRADGYAARWERTNDVNFCWFARHDKFSCLQNIMQSFDLLVGMYIHTRVQTRGKSAAMAFVIEYRGGRKAARRVDW